MDNEMKNGGFGVFGVYDYFDDMEYSTRLLAVYGSEDEAKAAAETMPVGGGFVGNDAVGEYVGYEVKAVQS